MAYTRGTRRTLGDHRHVSISHRKPKTLNPYELHVFLLVWIVSDQTWYILFAILDFAHHRTLAKVPLPMTGETTGRVRFCACVNYLGAACAAGHMENKMAKNISSTLPLRNKNFDSEDVILKIDSLLHDRKDSNQIIDLLVGLMSEDESELQFSLDCLQRIFTGFLNMGQISHTGNTSKNITAADPSEQYRIWLCDQYNECKKQLLLLLVHPRKAIQRSSTEALLAFMIAENDSIKNNNSSPMGTLKQVVSRLLSSEHNMKYAIAVVADPELDISLKIRILNCLCRIIKFKDTQVANEVVLLNAYAFLRVPWIPKKLAHPEGDESDVKKLKLYYTDAWVEFLKHKLPMKIYKRILVDLYEKVLPNMKNPLILTDFLTESYNYGGAVSLLALHGLFFLIQRCNLEYPNFFEKLYILLTEDIFQAKYRPQFFFLMDLFLSSLHVPAYLIGAFVKKLSRLALVAPPDALLIILPFVKNLLIRHPSVRILINRQDTSEVISDPYLPNEPSLSKCKAMESSLWEIKTLQHHWHPSVSKEANFINKSLPSLEVDLADVLDTDYSQLFTQEMETEIQKVPLSYDTPKGLFDRTEDKMDCSWTT